MNQLQFIEFYFYTPEDVIIDVYQLYKYYDQMFFNQVLQKTSLKWSNRMTLCAGTCKYQGLGSCTITLSQPLLKYRSTNQLKETLLHQMIHAYLFIVNPKACKQQGGHGKQFQQIMKNINSITSLNISIYHNFRDQVDNCRKHVWKCDGKCKDKPPFFGYVRRAMNRPPQPADNWFNRHQQQCGGKFIKISEPQKSKSKSEKSRSKQKQTQKSNDNKKPRKKKTKDKFELQKGKSIQEYIQMYEKQSKKQNS